MFSTETSNRATDQRSFSTEPSIIKDTTDSSALPGFRTSVIEPNVASDVAAKSKVVPLSDKLDFRETTESKPVEKVISFKREKPKLSKYKNTTPKVPRKEVCFLCFRGLSHIDRFLKIYD